MKSHPLISNLDERIKNHQFKNKEEFQTVISNLKTDDRVRGVIDDETERELLALYDRSISVKETPNFGDNTNYANVIADLEKKVRAGEFKDKEELSRYITNLKNNGVPSSVLTGEKTTEILALYDTLNPEKHDALDLNNYKGVKLDEKNVIVSTQDSAVLKTDRASSEMPQEFKEAQNELTAMGNDGLANADETFKHMREHKKEELNLIPIDEAINKDNIDKEVLSKIKFFITNEHIDYHAYHVDPEYGVFYDLEKEEVLEVRINEATGKYEIYRGGEKVYGDNQQTEVPEGDSADPALESDKEEEQKAYERKGPVRVLRKPEEEQGNNLGNSAFVQSSLLFIICIAISLLLAVFLIIHK